MALLPSSALDGSVEDWFAPAGFFSGGVLASCANATPLQLDSRRTAMIL
jgi:hypothetical protein